MEMANLFKLVCYRAGGLLRYYTVLLRTSCAGSEVLGAIFTQAALGLHSLLLAPERKRLPDVTAYSRGVGPDEPGLGHIPSGILLLQGPSHICLAQEEQCRLREIGLIVERWSP